MTVRLAIILVIACLGSTGAPVRVAVAEPSSANGSDLRLAGRVVQPDGTLRDHAVVVVRNGKIQRIVHDSKAGDSRTIRFGPRAVICPGLLDLFASPGATGQTTEDAKVVDPAASPIGVLDPSHRDFRAALRAGVTSVMIGPTATNLVSGVCVTARTHPTDGQLDILRDNGPLVFGFSDQVWRSDRAPTSRAGATHELRALIARARSGSADPRVNDAVSGKLDALIACATRQDVAAVRQLLGDACRRFGVVHTRDALDSTALLRNFRAPVVMGPYSMETSRRVLLGAAALANGDIDVAFRAGFPEASPDAMRLSAALAVRYGMDPAAARRAITISPARVAGVAAQVGSIAPGKTADLVVFSRDPLRMDARVLEVYVRGQRVYRARHPQTSQAGAKP